MKNSSTTLVKLRNLGNTLIVVEHDEETMEKADYIIDIGRKQVSTAEKSLRQARLMKSNQRKIP
jgi:excinuclease UvrABC ATPase subunit